jgi:hypothetical protein
VVKVDLCKERIQFEKLIIDKLLTSLDLVFESTSWDGFNLKVYYKKDHTSVCDRNDLIQYLDELDYSKIDSLKTDYNDIDSNEYCDSFYD